MTPEEALKEIQDIMLYTPITGATEETIRSLYESLSIAKTHDLKEIRIEEGKHTLCLTPKEHMIEVQVTKEI